MAAYVTTSEAQDYFDGRLNTQPWDDADDTSRGKALTYATRLINNLNFIGTKLTTDQENEFPRYGQTEVPQSVEYATCELALSLLSERDPTMEMERAGVISDAFDVVRSSYQAGFMAPHLMAGIVSPEAWSLLLPYLHDPLTLRLSKR